MSLYPLESFPSWVEYLLPVPGCVTVEGVDHLVDDLWRYAAAALGEDVDAQGEQHARLLRGEGLADAGRVRADQVHLQVSGGGRGLCHLPRFVPVIAQWIDDDA